MISRPAIPINPSIQITVINTVRRGKKTYTQLRKIKLKIPISNNAMGGRKRKLSLNIYPTYSVLNTDTPEYIQSALIPAVKDFISLKSISTSMSFCNPLLIKEINLGHLNIIGDQM